MGEVQVGTEHNNPGHKAGTEPGIVTCIDHPVPRLAPGCSIGFPRHITKRSGNSPLRFIRAWATTRDGIWRVSEVKDCGRKQNPHGVRSSAMTPWQKPLQFRPFRASDSALLGAWLSACGLGVPPGVDDHTWARRIIRDPNILCWAATQEGRTVGFLRLDLGPDRSAELTLIVHPERRRVGLGMALLDHALRQARASGLSRLLVVVETQNQAAQQFFLQAGFETAGASNGHLRLSRLVHRADRQPPLEISP